eukprot:9583711-Alexandrium_andersonii.AAC.1
MQGSLVHRFRLRVGQGRPYARQRSIPQGEPLFMSIVALLTLPWLKLCHVFSSVPRLLADDIRVIAHGEGASAKAAAGLASLLSYVAVLGGSISATSQEDNKSF